MTAGSRDAGVRGQPGGRRWRLLPLTRAGWLTAAGATVVLLAAAFLPFVQDAMHEVPALRRLAGGRQLVPLAIALGGLALWGLVRAVRGGDRSVLGLALGGLLALVVAGWLVFAAGEVLFAH